MLTKNIPGISLRISALALITVGLAAADIVATYDAAGVQTPSPATLCAGTTTCIVGEEDFNSWTGGAFSTDFGTSNQIQGSYSGGFLAFPADQYGGAGGTGTYPEVFGQSYTL